MMMCDMHTCCCCLFPLSSYPSVDIDAAGVVAFRGDIVTSTLCRVNGISFNAGLPLAGRRPLNGCNFTAPPPPLLPVTGAGTINGVVVELEEEAAATARIGVDEEVVVGVAATGEVTSYLLAEIDAVPII